MSAYRRAQAPLGLGDVAWAIEASIEPARELEGVASRARGHSPAGGGERHLGYDEPFAAAQRIL